MFTAVNKCHSVNNDTFTGLLIQLLVQLWTKSVIIYRIMQSLHLKLH